MKTVHFAAIVLTDPAAEKALLLLRAGWKKLNPNTYSGIGGKMEGDETPQHCVLREASLDEKPEAPQINWANVTDIRHRLTLTRPRPDLGEIHVMHWLTGTLHQTLTDFSSSEGTLHWKKIVDLPLPLKDMSHASFAAIPFILSRPREEDRLFTAFLDETVLPPVLKDLA